MGMSTGKTLDSSANAADPISEIDRALQEGERIRWSGKPHESGFRRRVSSITTFGGLFSGFAVFWTCIAASMMWLVPSHKWGPMNEFAPPGTPGDPPPFLMKIGFPLFGVPFLAVGVYCLLAGSREARRASRTGYAITNYRVIVLEIAREGAPDIESYSPIDLRVTKLATTSDGTGDIEFTGVREFKRKVRWTVNDVPSQHRACTA